MPRIATFTDPAVAAGTFHDAVWLVETSLVPTPVTVILDANTNVFMQHQHGVRALALALPRSRVIVLDNGGPTFRWMEPWQDHDVELYQVSPGSHALADLCKLSESETLENRATVLLVAGQTNVFTRDEV